MIKPIIFTLFIFSNAYSISIEPQPQQIPELDPPMWPQFFQQGFIETYPGKPNRVTGQIFYNSVSNKMRVDRTDGQFDEFCSSVLSSPTACSIVFKDNKKYIYYPDLRICCFCCDKDHGCPLPPPNFLAKS